MPTKKTILNEARQQTERALHSARCAVERLERITDDADRSVCTDSAREAESILQQATTDAKLAGSAFGLFEMM